MTAKTAISVLTTQPFSARAPGLLYGQASDRLGYAFNCEQPAGVKLLSKLPADRLRALVGEERAVPNIPQIGCPEDQALFDSGLIRLAGSYNRSAHAPTTSDYSLNVWLHVTDGCNLGCFYCYIPKLEKQIEERSLKAAALSLKPQNALEISDSLLAHCRSESVFDLHVKFAGGEPTLAIESIDIMCRYLRQHAGDIKITFGILTNGVYDAACVEPVLVRHNIRVSISLDGINASHDQTRYTSRSGSRAGSFSTIHKNVARLERIDITPFFLFTVTQKNIVELEQFSDFISAQFSGGFRLSLERSTRQVPYETQLLVSEKLSSFYDHVAKNLPTDRRLDHKAKFAEWNLDRKKTTACSSCRGYLAVRREGDVSSCQMRLDTPVGNLLVEPLKQVIDRFSDTLSARLLVHPERKTGACSNCEFRFVCAGGCPQHTMNVYETTDHPSPWCFVYGKLFEKYIEANAVHMARRHADAIIAMNRSVQQNSILN